MFNLLPGAGLGFTASRLVGLGLAPVGPVAVPPYIPPVFAQEDDGWGGGDGVTLLDNQYAIHHFDDDEIAGLLLPAICTVIAWDR